MSEIQVNDGGGLYDNIGMIDSLIVDCNELTKNALAGNGVGFCAKVVEMVQKLSRLRKGVENDIESRDRQNRELLAEASGGEHADP